MLTSSPHTDGPPAEAFACHVVEVRQLSTEIRGIWLQSLDSAPFAFRAGQYIDILLSGSRKRSFSIANKPRADGIFELHIRKVAGGGAIDDLFAMIDRGEVLYVSGPYGRFTLDHGTETAPTLFIAGGTGFAPIKAMLEQAFEEKPSQIMQLFWGARTRSELYLHDLASAWAHDHENFDYVPVLSVPEHSDHWNGVTGLVHEAAVRQARVLPQTHLYTSGPLAMVQAVRDSFLAQGLPEQQIHSDFF